MWKMCFPDARKLEFSWGGPLNPPHCGFVFLALARLSLVNGLCRPHFVKILDLHLPSFAGTFIRIPWNVVERFSFSLYEDLLLHKQIKHFPVFFKH